jgi:hypothetical protein
MKAQPVPPAALRDPEAVEMARVWIAEKGLHCGLNIGLYANNGIDETRAWGILLADMARHVSNALAERGSAPGADIALSSIWQTMAVELDKPTSATTGSFGSTPTQ